MTEQVAEDLCKDQGHWEVTRQVLKRGPPPAPQTPPLISHAPHLYSPGQVQHKERPLGHFCTSVTAQSPPSNQRQGTEGPRRACPKPSQGSQHLLLALTWSLAGLGGRESAVGDCGSIYEASGRISAPRATVILSQPQVHHSASSGSSLSRSFT